MVNRIEFAGARCEHELPVGEEYAKSRQCQHKKAESSRAEFGKLPVIRCVKCSMALGRRCTECRKVY